MSDETSGIDPYEAVLTDLYTKRDQINQAIAAIESLRSGVAAAMRSAPAVGDRAGSKLPIGDAGGPGALLGMSISEAAKKLLATKRTTLKNTELATLFKAGGLILNSKDWVNTIGAVLTRRANDVGDIVKVERGTWGLKEWYPNRSFNKKSLAEEVQAAKGEASEAPKKASMFAGAGIKRYRAQPNEGETSETE
jgi:hypothetical protein